MTRDQQLQPRKRPIQGRARLTVEAILEASAQVFEELGYAKTTTDRIAERAGVSIGTLYQYFPGKDALLVALAEQHVDKGLEMSAQMLDTSVHLERIPLEDLLRSFLQAAIALHRERPRLHQMLFVEAPKSTGFLEALSAREDALADQLRVVLERHPEVRLPDPDLGVYVLIHVTEGLVHDYIVHPPPGNVDEERFTGEMVRLLRGYLAPEAGGTCRG